MELEVRLLGGFSMTRRAGAEICVLAEQDSTSRRLWSFLEYMAVHHDRGVTQEELIDLLWGDSDSANPANTMKTMLHRARQLLEQRLGLADGKQILLYRRGMYRWGQGVRLRVDVEKFDALCQQAERGDREKALEAIDMYRGDALPSAVGTPWVISLRAFYHAKYLDLCARTASALLEDEEFADAAHICQGAVEIDPYDEGCHLLLMQAMAGNGQSQAAIQHYHEVSGMLMDQLGVTPSEEMTALYRQLAKSDKSVELDLGVVRGLMLEKEEKRGAFLCDMEVFQNIYRLGARSAMRSGQALQLAMITVLDMKGQRLEGERCAAAMEELRRAIQNRLRVGDVFTRFSPMQYLILLPGASYENGIMVVERILSGYRATLPGKTTRTKFSLLPVQPIESGEGIPGAFRPME